MRSTPCTASDLISLSSGALSGKVGVSINSGASVSLIMGIEDELSLLSRQEAYVAIEKLIKAAGVEMPECDVEETLSAYSDGDEISDDARQAVANLTELGIINIGMGRDCAPQETMTYEQCQVVMMRVAALVG